MGPWSVQAAAEHRVTAPATSHRQDIQGLRAIAILLVLVHHARLPGLPGGFLGVDMFFVISGYLMAGLIDNWLNSGIFTLKDFYARRIRRLFPAAYATLTLTALAAPWLLDSVEYGNFVKQLAGSFAFVVNIVLWKQTDYFSTAAELKPLLHMWSLAVEEQFYLTFPLLIAMMGGRTKLLIGTLIAICVGCLLWRLHIVHHGAPFGFHQSGNSLHPYTYCASDARMDSIAYGCLTAVLFHRFAYRLKGVFACWSAIGIAGVLVIVSLILRDADFRETYRYSIQGLAMVCLFYGLFGDSAGLAVRLLEIPVMRKMGVLSYGAYLWHLEPVNAYYWWSGTKMMAADTTTKLIMIVVGFAFTYAMAQLSFTMTTPLRNLRSRFHS